MNGNIKIAENACCLPVFIGNALLKNPRAAFITITCDTIVSSFMTPLGHGLLQINLHS